MINDIVKQQPIIEFTDYDLLLSEATMIANKLDTMTVTEDNVKEQKKLLAKVNKSIKNLNDRRIEIKKEIMKPYDEFAEQIKDIETVVKKADTRLRNQVRELEEIERSDKKGKILTLWEEKIEVSPYKNILNFEHWFEERHLNKSLSMNKVEIDLDNWLVEVEKNLDYLNELEEYKEVAINEYLKDFDLAITLSYVKVLSQMTDKIEDIKDDSEFEVIEDDVEKTEIVTERVMFEVFNEDIDKVIEFMNSNKIYYVRYRN